MNEKERIEHEQLRLLEKAIRINRQGANIAFAAILIGLLVFGVAIIMCEIQYYGTI